MTKTYIINGEPVEIRLFTMAEMQEEFDETAMLLDKLDAILETWDLDNQPL